MINYFKNASVHIPDKQQEGLPSHNLQQNQTVAFAIYKAISYRVESIGLLLGLYLILYYPCAGGFQIFRIMSLPPLAGRRIVIVGSSGAGMVAQIHGCSDFVEYLQIHRVRISGVNYNNIE